MTESKRVPLFRTKEEDDAFEEKCKNNAWKLIDPDTGKEYKSGDEIKHDGDTYKITHLERPRHPGSTGHVSARRAGDVYDSRYYAGVWGLKYV